MVEKEEEEIPDEQEIEIGASAIRKANGYGEKGYVIQFTYSDGTGMNPSDLAYKKALEEYVKTVSYTHLAFLRRTAGRAGIPGGALCVSGAPPQCDLYAGQYRSGGGCAESLAYFVPDAAGAGQRMVF